MKEPPPREAEAFLVCGLGSLGQNCVAVLKEFGVLVNAIDVVDIQQWDFPQLPTLIDEFFVGDCCQIAVLEQAQLERHRAILLVTSDERVNIEAAFAVRSLNAKIRIIVRSAQDNLNDLLTNRLGNFIAFEATQLPAPSFALAALAGETRGFFTLEDRLLRVVRITIEAQHAWCERRLLHTLNTNTRRLLSHTPRGQQSSLSFHGWQPDTKVESGDSIVYIEAAEPYRSAQSRPVRTAQQLWQALSTRLTQPAIEQALLQVWRQGTQTQRVAIVSSIVMLSLFICSSILYKLQYPQIGLQDTLNVSLVLLLGGYDNLFGQLEMPFPVPWWLHVFSILLTVSGTLFIGILYAILTERVVVARFQFTRRQPIPKDDHVVLVGLGRVGQRIATLLHDLKQPFVGVHETTPDPALPAHIPLVVDALKSALGKVNLAAARSVLAVTDDEVVNLEVALRAQAINPTATLVIRTFKPSFQQNIAKLLPTARVLGAYALAAEAFAAAAFGENILSVFRLNNQTLLVTEYRVEPTDTLVGLLLAEVAYGYGIVPILHQRAADQPARLMPSDDIRLHVGDRMVVIAPIEGLKRIEGGVLAPRSHIVQIQKALSQDSAFDGATAIARVSGCDISTARALMAALPAPLPFPLYLHQAKRLVSELSKAQVAARLLSSNG
ncbi:NAD-binding protein [Myxacorys almedinensis]|uniref:Potassium transporter TrkA n=1 Tax=Myxacorys almedinensis A TaxID=2690445 RepID=A0A8J7Z4E3_9CYAN|nr:NAD-binding protein [Myxacorys almedinensis]NDJ17956.1 potassium transporter TrkA [Myxacorys almedinensis A]